jgi:hypothetical protein
MGVVEEVEFPYWKVKGQPSKRAYKKETEYLAALAKWKEARDEYQSSEHQRKLKKAKKAEEKRLEKEKKEKKDRAKRAMLAQEEERERQRLYQIKQDEIAWFSQLS